MADEDTNHRVIVKCAKRGIIQWMFKGIRRKWDVTKAETGKQYYAFPRDCETRELVE